MLDAGWLWLPALVDEQCSDVYFFLGTRALKVAVLRLEAGFGLLLACSAIVKRRGSQRNMAELPVFSDAPHGCS